MKLIIIILLGISCHTWSQQKVDITRPMYGETEKDERFKKADDDFRKDMLKKFGSIDMAVNDILDKAWALFYQNDLVTAMMRFNQAWLLNPDYPDAYFGFAALLEMKGESAKAIRFYTTAAEKDKDNSRSFICLMLIADCKEQLNDIKGAIEALEKIKIFRSDDPLVFKKSGNLYMTIDQQTAALEAYTKAIQLDQRDPVTFHNRAYLYGIMEQYVNAIMDYSMSISLDSTFVSAYLNLGILEMQTNNVEVAKQDFQKAIKFDPKSGVLRRYLGLAKLNLEDTQGACDDFKKAKELGDTLVDELIDEFCK